MYISIEKIRIKILKCKMRKIIMPETVMDINQGPLVKAM